MTADEWTSAWSIAYTSFVCDTRYSHFLYWMAVLCECLSQHRVGIVGGSDLVKQIEQIGDNGQHSVTHSLHSSKCGTFQFQTIMLNLTRAHRLSSLCCSGGRVGLRVQ